NGLGADLTVREGQFLLVPPAGSGAAPTRVVTAPGVGSPTPLPPSASAPLPDEEVAPASQAADPAPVPQDLGGQQSAPAEG
ncbi:hypothetical protein Q0P08_15595, partial [Staphylococcus aureus]|nr:hypothetical protein [Staphylococcus aureus]